MSTLVDRFWAKVIKDPDGCWKWTAATHEFGYGLLGRGGRGEGIARAHVVSYEIHFGPVPEGIEVCHKCDNPPCTRPDHLFLGTRKDNHADMQRKGRMSKPPTMRGAANPAAKVTPDIVRAIRAEKRERGYIPRLMARFGVSRSLIKYIVAGTTWADVT